MKILRFLFPEILHFTLAKEKRKSDTQSLVYAMTTHFMHNGENKSIKYPQVRTFSSLRLFELISVELLQISTRIHSSRMRTARFSGDLFGWGGGGVYLVGVCSGGVCPGGGCLSGGVYYTPSCGQTDACENITLP